MAFITLLAALVAAVASAGPACSTGTCPTGKPIRAAAPVLLQKKSTLERKVDLDDAADSKVDLDDAADSDYDAEDSEDAKEEYHSDCSQRLGHGKTHPAACVVIKDNKALLVYVPYGRPGWDLPGGWHKGGHEPDCQTAEREVCEETRHKVRATQRISGNVFRCDLQSRNVCHKKVDEGFLRKGWFSVNDLDRLNFRPYTWGNKKRILQSQLGGRSAWQPPHHGGPNLGSSRVDGCGCKIGQAGWSSTSGYCKSGSWTSPREAAMCSHKNHHNNHGGGSPKLDACGCEVGRQGWSTTRHSCRYNSVTSSWEADRCRKGRSWLQEEVNSSSSSDAPLAANSSVADSSLEAAAADAPLAPGSDNSSAANSSDAPAAASA